METENLRSRLEAVKELKAEYGIGTQDALAYIRDQDSHRKLREDLITVLKTDRVAYRPGLREVQNVSHWLSDIIDELISETKVEAGEGEVLPVNVYYLGGKKSFPKKIIIRPDFIKFFTNYAKAVDSGTDPETAVFKTLKDIFDTEEPFLEISGKKVSFRDLNITPDGNGVYSWLADGEDFPLYFDLNINQIPFSQRAYLYHASDKGDYKTALNEHMLGNIWTERRIAISTIVYFTRSEDLSVNDRIDKALEDLKFDYILYGDKDMYRYLRLAIIKNRRWIEKVLGN